MSTELQATKFNKENTDNRIKSKMAATLSDERKTLKTLQLTADGKLLGSEKPAKQHKQNKIIAYKKPIQIFKDKPVAASSPVRRSVHEMCVQASPEHTEMYVQTDISGVSRVFGSPDLHNDSGVGAGDLDQEAYDLMVKDPIPESYWRELAEERRQSLAEALAENEKLHQSMEELKDENQNLSLLASQAEHLASVLNSAFGNDEEEEDDTDNQDNDTPKDKDNTDTPGVEDNKPTAE
ncbi:geminin-like [Mya arenaria]|uniref:geminin-like n=1 Tax=Mya arenaria TaxID=6604 RepID=UPI0022E8C633|nr:geminin-like [Mya arenaria]